ncbi:hypothetical protein QUB13_05635 [Microcoleus sp. B4-D4]
MQDSEAVGSIVSEKLSDSSPTPTDIFPGKASQFESDRSIGLKFFQVGNPRGCDRLFTANLDKPE